MIFRGTASIGVGEGAGETRICFVDASSDEEATTKICEGVALVYDITPFQVGVRDLQNEDQLKVRGLSRNAMWRLFEDSWYNGRCDKWIAAPLFLLSDMRLPHVWASLPLAGGREVFADSLMLPAERAWVDVVKSKIDDLALAMEDADEEVARRLRHELNGLRELMLHRVFRRSAESREISTHMDQILGS